MNNSKTYQITLTPADWFFFGGEITYGGSDTANYYARSNLFPQESSILGMLRYEILKKEGLLTTDEPVEDQENKVKEAIGPAGFRYDPQAPDAPIGRIERISPVMIQHEYETGGNKRTEIYCAAPFDHGYTVDFLSGNTFTYLNGRKKALPAIARFDVKNYYRTAAGQWLSLCPASQKPTLKTDDIFLHKTRIGITKHRSVQDVKNEEGFFKGDWHRLKPGYRFVFYARLGIAPEPQALVNLGAERSVFVMRTEEIPGADDRFFTALYDSVPAGDNRIVFLSDAFVPESVAALCRFAWTDTISFRYLMRPWKAGRNYATLDRNRERSIRYNLLRRGSVLYYETPEDKEAILRSIDSPYLQRFGYNLYRC